ncbi:alpha/beta-hydrolase [Corynespora cassiicola Philippines]|uniref:Alpha/beta-hydrolase n=1 Tax=Corynespora cassiicola Philippines TaxID=1448308 RepID=A0A2T2N7R2_CORCC|nr:alpha/beta-hydrolase [Corynespora cassiicola Philippines]
MTTAALNTQDAKLASLGMQKTIVNAENVVTYSRGLGAASEENPVLVLVHGYPQSTYMWRHLIPLLPKSSPIFAPDLPGYGGSQRIPKNDKLSIGTTLLSALRTELNRTSSGPPRPSIPIILIGHDRGARIAHRLAVSGVPGFRIQAACLIDIVPTTTQWAAFADPKQSMGYFHFPLLANVEIARGLIAAYGGPRWVREMVARWAGSGLRRIEEEGGMEVYAGFFESADVVEATCEDYAAGATVDVEAQWHDQEAGRKIEVPVLLVYSGVSIGSRFDFGTVWNDWVKEGVEITKHPLGDGAGHFGAEEAPEETAAALKKWFQGLGLSLGD